MKGRRKRLNIFVNWKNCDDNLLFVQETKRLSVCAYVVCLSPTSAGAMVKVSW